MELDIKKQAQIIFGAMLFGLTLAPAMAQGMHDMHGMHSTAPSKELPVNRVMKATNPRLDVPVTSTRSTGISASRHWIR